MKGETKMKQAQAPNQQAAISSFQRKKVILAWLLAILMLLGLILPITQVLRAEDNQSQPSGTSSEPAPNDNGQGQNSDSNIFIADSEVESAFYGEKVDFYFNFHEINPESGQPFYSNLSDAKSRYSVTNVYLLTSPDAGSFPFLLDKQEYRGTSVRDIRKGQYRYEFRNLTINPEVSTKVYTLSFKIYYQDLKTGAYLTQTLTSYINIQGKSEAKDAQVLFKTVNPNVPQAKPGQWVPIQLYLANYGLDTVQILNTSLLIDGLPLEVRQADQTAQVEMPLLPISHSYNSTPDTGNGTMLIVDYGSFQVSKNAPGGIQKIGFEVTYLDAKQVLKRETVYTYIDVLGAGKDGKASMPRVLIQGYRTEPKEIKGGQPFTLILTLKNTSETATVSNMRLGLSSQNNESKESVETFTPESGATAYYIKEIAPNGTFDFKLNLSTSPSLNQRAYPLTISLDYQDDAGQSYNTSEQVSLYVRQNVRLEFGRPEITPEQAHVGDDISMFFNIINKGRVTLKNAELRLPKGSPFRMDTVFLKDLEAGSSTQAELQLKALHPAQHVKLLLAYEDDNGTEYTIEKEFKVNVTDAAPAVPDPSMQFDENGNLIGQDGDAGMNNGGSSSLWIWIVLAIVIFIIIVLVLVLIKHRHKRQQRRTIKIDDDDF